MPRFTVYLYYVEVLNVYRYVERLFLGTKNMSRITNFLDLKTLIKVIFIKSNKSQSLHSMIGCLLQVPIKKTVKRINIRYNLSKPNFQTNFHLSNQIYINVNLFQYFNIKQRGNITFSKYPSNYGRTVISPEAIRT